MGWRERRRIPGEMMKELVVLSTVTGLQSCGKARRKFSTDQRQMLPD